MNVVRSANVVAIERVFIEDIQTGDWVLSTRTGGNSDPRVWQVNGLFEVNRATAWW